MEKNSPRRISKETPSTALTSLNVFDTRASSTAGESVTRRPGG